MASQRRPPGGTSLLTTLTVNPSLVRGRGVPISASSGLAVITLISPPARFLAPRSGSLSDLKEHRLSQSQCKRSRFRVHGAVVTARPRALVRMRNRFTGRGVFQPFFSLARRSLAHGQSLAHRFPPSGKVRRCLGTSFNSTCGAAIGRVPAGVSKHVREPRPSQSLPPQTTAAVIAYNTSAIAHAPTTF